MLSFEMQQFIYGSVTQRGVLTCRVTSKLDSRLEDLYTFVFRIYRRAQPFLDPYGLEASQQILQEYVIYSMKLFISCVQANLPNTLHRYS